MDPSEMASPHSHDINIYRRHDEHQSIQVEWKRHTRRYCCAIISKR